MEFVTEGNSANMQKDESGSHGPHQLPTLEQTNIVHSYSFGKRKHSVMAQPVIVRDLLSAPSAAKNLPGLLISNNTNYVMRSCLSLNVHSVIKGLSHEKVGSNTNKLFIKISSSLCWPLNYMMNE